VWSLLNTAINLELNTKRIQLCQEWGIALDIYSVGLNPSRIVGFIPGNPFGNHLLFVKSLTVRPGVHLLGDDVGLLAHAGQKRLVR
jgi:hypothetical protein